PLGSGPYVIVDHQPGIEITLERNPEYFDADAYPYDTVILKVLADSTAKLNALKSGQVDAAAITLQTAGEAEASGLTVFEGTGGFDALIVQNPAESPLPP